MDIFIDFATRLGPQDKDGEPLVKWSTPEECFEAWKECWGRPCDYSGLATTSSEAAAGSSGPATRPRPRGPSGCIRTALFFTGPDICEDYGHDVCDRQLVQRDGVQGPESPTARDPEAGPVRRRLTTGRTRSSRSLLITGRTLYHFHTRTKRVALRELVEAAPHVWVELGC